VKERMKKLKTCERNSERPKRLVKEGKDIKGKEGQKNTRKKDAQDKQSWANLPSSDQLLRNQWWNVLLSPSHVQVFPLADTQLCCQPVFLVRIWPLNYSFKLHLWSPFQISS
jgi:hypothetical protein